MCRGGGTSYNRGMQVRAVILGALMLGLAGCGAVPQLHRSAPLTTEVRRSPWNSENSVGEQLNTKHYRIYTTAKRPTIINYLPGYMEAAHENYRRLTGLSERTYDKPSVIYMMGSRQEWVVLTKNVIHAHRDIYLSIEAGGYCYKGICVFWDLGGRGTFSVAAHEGLHQFLYRRMRNHLPMWAEEGLCVSAEGHEITARSVRFTPDDNPFRFSSLRKAILREYWMPIRKLLPLDGGDLATGGTARAVGYYAQLWALSMFLRSHPVYGDGLKRMIEDAERGGFREELDIPPEQWRTLRGRRYNRVVSAPLFRHYITDDLDDFDRQFEDFARRFAGLKE